MRCSSCSKVLKPIVAVDIDGTLGDYHRHFVRFATSYLGRANALMYGGGEPFRDWFIEEFGTDLRTFRDVKLAYRQGGQKRSMPVYRGAAQLTREVRAGLGAELWLTTTRPYLRLDGVDPDTREWLGRAAIDYDGLLYDDHKYPALAERVDPERIAAVLDDLPEQYDAAAAAFGPHVPILRKTTYNRRAQRPRAVADLAEATRAIDERIYIWRDSHE